MLTIPFKSSIFFIKSIFSNDKISKNYDDKFRGLYCALVKLVF